MTQIFSQNVVKHVKKERKKDFYNTIFLQKSRHKKWNKRKILTKKYLQFKYRYGILRMQT